MDHLSRRYSRRVLSLAISSALLAPAIARASDSPAFIGIAHAQQTRDANSNDYALSAPILTLDPANASAGYAAKDGVADSGKTPDAPVLTLAGGASRIHGFGDFRINTQYITPRGLVAEEDSPQFQVVTGLVFDVFQGNGFISDVSIIGGAWGDFNTHPDKSKVTGADIWTEEDFFGGFDVKFASKWDFAWTIQAWTFPDLTKGGVEVDPTTEYNMDFKFSFDDTEYLKDWAMHPYVDVFWNFAGESSPVVSQAGGDKNDHTFYVELGIAPSYTLTAISDLPITFTLPAYWTVGDSAFWGDRVAGKSSNLGVASIGLKISAPLKFIPADLGNWSTYVGVTYIHTCNPNLTAINAGTGADSNLVLGYAGIGFNF